MKKALLCLFLINWFSGYSQKTAQVPVNTVTSNADAFRIDENTGQISYIRFKDADMLPISALQQVLDKLFGPGYEYREINHSSDEIGFTHHRLMQVMNGIPVTHSMIIVHELSGKIVSVNGDFYPVDKLPSSPSLSKNNAIEKAMFYAPSTLYKQNQRGEDSLLKINTSNPQASYLPDPELVYINKDFFTYPLDMRLAYRVRLYSVEPLFNDDIFIDAITGELLGKSPQIHHSNVPGKFVTKYSGTKFGNTDSTAPGNYRLRENVRGNGIETYNLKKGTSYGAAVDFTDADNTWNNVNGNKDEVATDAHWGAEVTYDYYKSVHGRLSFDNNNAKIKSYVHYANAYNNAFWDGVEMTYGDGDGTTFTPLAALDVCGHEITHAVTSYTANLIYSYESGQLNESFSDIFGQTIEIWARPTQWDWKIGEDITPSFNGIRRMSNPNSNGQPDTYLGTFWYSGAGDNGGVHYNSGVQNFWYYLLVAGGTGTNDIGNAFKVDSIGLKKAEKIAYRNLSVYLTPSSKHKDARFYSIIAATDLY
ncbi:MAG: M4 family metallopeptidase, partial [Bacteroidia bacterium]|nr:M4 family metallopeptidase [Bacteroidia bacterium]